MMFSPDRATYIRTHWTMAAVAMLAGMVVLALLGNPHIWTGAVGGLAAVALRGWYLMDEELAHVWTLRDNTLEGPGGRSVPLNSLKEVRTMGAAVQLITSGGDKHLIKFQADPAATRTRIEAAQRAATGAPSGVSPGSPSGTPSGSDTAPE